MFCCLKCLFFLPCFGWYVSWVIKEIKWRICTFHNDKCFEQLPFWNFKPWTQLGVPCIPWKCLSTWKYQIMPCSAPVVHLYCIYFVTIHIVLSAISPVITKWCMWTIALESVSRWMDGWIDQSINLSVNQSINRSIH